MFTENKIKSKLRSGHSVIGIEFMSDSHKLIEMTGHAGFDFIQFDMEHTPYNFSEIEAFVRTADSVSLTSLVRVAEISSTNIRRVLESGTMGVILPQVRTADQVADAIAAMHYAPRGTRGMCPITRAARYSESSWESYVQWSQKELMCVALIENEEAMANIADILRVDGLDAVGIGTGDLGQSLGVGGAGMRSPLVRQAVESLSVQARAVGMPMWAMPDVTDPVTSMRQMMRDGIRAFAFDADMLMYGRACDTAMSAFQEATKEDVRELARQGS
ncbi:HpcH/HpaI aldolase family protein [Specibacter sp. RAF43]|uniref:HpcH/HpaI aldolase family protein n=1 Tax=Specibacter sp. RAF43 TaxID=3233057 RepID=UPI003F98DCC8